MNQDIKSIHEQKLAQTEEFSERNRIMGAYGEDFAREFLRNKFSSDKYQIVDGHNLAHLDWVIIDKKTEQFVAVFEVKTTTTDKLTLSAGSPLQLMVAMLHGVPFYLFVIRIEKESFAQNKFKHLGVEFYGSEEFTPDLQSKQWVINPSHTPRGDWDMATWELRRD